MLRNRLNFTAVGRLSNAFEHLDQSYIDTLVKYKRLER